MAVANHNNLTCYKGQDKTSNVVAIDSNQTEEPSGDIHSPLRVARKGRPRSKRKVSKVDQLVRKKRKTNYQHPHIFTIDECSEGNISQINGNNLHVSSSIEILTRGECDDDYNVGCVYTIINFHL